MGVQQVLDPLHRGLAPQCELLSRSRRRVGIDAHLEFLTARWNVFQVLTVGSADHSAEPNHQVISYFLPQQIFSASAVVMLSTPSTGLSVTSLTPVS